MARNGWEAATGFPSWTSYASGLAKTPQTVTQRVFARVTVGDQLAETHTVGGMKKVLGWQDLVMLGVGMMLGAGVFVTTGQVAVHNTGPGVVLSYLVAGISALLSSLCYAEFSANMPLSGGAYSYISAVFGEFLAWITVANLIFEYILANAAAVRGFLPYFAMLINVPSSKLIVPFHGYDLDWFAFGWVLLFTGMLVYGTKESSLVNVIMNIVHLLLVAFIVVAGFAKSNPANAQPFLPFGVKGVFSGAAIVFFSFIGFDAVATSAEEVKRPARDLPLGILGALGIVTVFYMLLSAALVMMVPLSAMSDSAAFAAAFDYVGLPWARYIVAAGAVVGILSSTLGNCYAQSRIIAAVGRQHLLPPVLAKVHPKFGTPYVATALSGVVTAVVALFTAFDELVSMVSISTLFAFWMVGLALLWYRYYQPGRTTRAKTALLSLQLLVLFGASLGFTIWYHLMPHDWIGLVVCAALFFAVTASLYATSGQGTKPSSYAAPLFPLVPALSVALNTFLMGQLDVLAYIRFATYTAAIIAVYLLYSMHASAEHAEALKLPQQQLQLSSGELVDAQAVLVEGAVDKRIELTVPSRGL